MKAQYQVLSALKKVDEKVVRLQAEIDRIPEEINKLQAALKERTEEYEKLKQSFETREKDLRKSELELKEKEDNLRKAESKMMEVKTNEEYQAALKENQVQKDEKSQLEDKVLGTILDLEEQRKKLKEVEKDFQAYSNAVKSDTKQLEEENKKLFELLQEQLQKRALTTSELNAEIAGLYNRVIERVKGIAVVRVENGMCLGCYMKVRPQLYNEILGYKAIHRCPSCGRILISEPTDEQESAELAAK